MVLIRLFGTREYDLYQCTFEMSRGLIKLNRTAFKGILLPFIFNYTPAAKTKHTNYEKLINQRKCENGLKANPTFSILHHSLSITFLVFLSNKNGRYKYAL